jgi:hypothetical protein
MRPINTGNLRSHPTWGEVRDAYLADRAVSEAYQALGKSLRGDNWAHPEPSIPQEVPA